MNVAGLIDTHAHLDAEQFASDLPAVLARAKAAGLEAIIAVATTAQSSEICLELARKHSILRPSVGIHPNNILQEPADAWDQVVRLANTSEVVAIGETGLDRHWHDTPFAIQEDYFARHLDLARSLDRAIVIHCREAEADTLRMLREAFNRHGPIRGVMHAFSGTLETAEASLAMGLHISFAGPLTYKNATELRNVARTIPRNRLLVETDSPYLSPVPLRGQRNEPAHVIHTAAVLADLVGLTPTALAEQTTANAQALFGLSPGDSRS